MSRACVASVTRSPRMQPGAAEHTRPARSGGARAARASKRETEHCRSPRRRLECVARSLRSLGSALLRSAALHCFRTEQRNSWATHTQHMSASEQATRGGTNNEAAHTTAALADQRRAKLSFSFAMRPPPVSQYTIVVFFYDRTVL